MDGEGMYEDRTTFTSVIINCLREIEKPRYDKFKRVHKTAQRR